VVHSEGFKVIHLFHIHFVPAGFHASPNTGSAQPRLIHSLRAQHHKPNKNIGLLIYKSKLYYRPGGLAPIKRRASSQNTHSLLLIERSDGQFWVFRPREGSAWFRIPVLADASASAFF
jgi:hypothetical protein